MSYLQKECMESLKSPGHAYEFVVYAEVLVKTNTDMEKWNGGSGILYLNSKTRWCNV